MSISSIKEAFEAFATEFESMISGRVHPPHVLLGLHSGMTVASNLRRRAMPMVNTIIRPSEKWDLGAPGFIEENLQRSPYN